MHVDLTKEFKVETILRNISKEPLVKKALPNFLFERYLFNCKQILYHLIGLDYSLEKGIYSPIDEVIFKNKVDHHREYTVEELKLLIKASRLKIKKFTGRISTYMLDANILS